MSYESKMLEQFAMPTRKQVEQTLLRALLKHEREIPLKILPQGGYKNAA